MSLDLRIGKTSSTRVFINFEGLYCSDFFVPSAVTPFLEVKFNSVINTKKSVTKHNLSKIKVTGGCVTCHSPVKNVVLAFFFFAVYFLLNRLSLHCMTRPFLIWCYQKYLLRRLKLMMPNPLIKLSLEKLI